MGVHLHCQQPIQGQKSPNPSLLKETNTYQANQDVVEMPRVQNLCQSRTLYNGQKMQDVCNSISVWMYQHSPSCAPNADKKLTENSILLSSCLGSSAPSLSSLHSSDPCFSAVRSALALMNSDLTRHSLLRSSSILENLLCPRHYSQEHEHE